MFGRMYIDDAWGHAPTTHRTAQSLGVLKNGTGPQEKSTFVGELNIIKHC